MLEIEISGTHCAYAQIDWPRGYEFLDQELRAVVQDAELGKRFVDKLVRVNRISGEEDWIYIHLEVQGSPQAEFAERMFVYNYRLYDRYHHPVASMAVLARLDDATTSASEAGVVAQYRTVRGEGKNALRVVGRTDRD